MSLNGPSPGCRNVSHAVHGEEGQSFPDPLDEMQKIALPSS
jgi:hypothetical protein